VYRKIIYPQITQMTQMGRLRTNMKKKLKLCVVGCGRVSSSHLDGILQTPAEIDLIALVSRDPAKSAEFAKKYGANKCYGSLEEALADPEIEAVDICLPNHLHKDAVLKCAKAGKHILVEKPMANTIAECEEMNRAAENAGVKLMVGQSRRFHEAVFKSKELVDKGEIGKVFSITALLFAYLRNPPTDWWSSKEKTGGLMIPLWGNHIIDYILWIFGEMPERVYCEAYSNSPNWEGEDETTILMGYSGNRHATIKMSWNTVLKPAVEWDGKGKMLSSSDIIYERRVQGSDGSLLLKDETFLSLNAVTVMEGKQIISNFAMQMREFASAIRENREPLTSGRFAMDIIKVQEAALKSAENHNVINL